MWGLFKDLVIFLELNLPPLLTFQMSLQSKVVRICFPVWLAGGLGTGYVSVVTCLQERIFFFPLSKGWGLHSLLPAWQDGLIICCSSPPPPFPGPCSFPPRQAAALVMGDGRDHWPAWANYLGFKTTGESKDRSGNKWPQPKLWSSSSLPHCFFFFWKKKAHWNCLNCNAISCSFKRSHFLIMCFETFNTISIMQKK